MLGYISVFVLAFGLTYLLTPLIRRICLKRKYIDYPNERKIHSVPTPRLGGVAIYISFFLALIPVLFLSSNLPSRFLRTVVALFASSSIIFFLGLYDDIKGANAKVKFGFQILAALLLIYGFNFKIKCLTNPFTDYSSINFGWLAVPITLLWIVGLTNAINIIDGLDGLACGVVSIVSITLFLVAIHQGDTAVALLTGAMAGTTLAFLRFNFNPAKIFMGDTGSMFLGFLLSAIAITSYRKSTVLFALLVPFIALGVPIIDTMLAIFRRFLSGSHPFQADQEHFHHRLLGLGLSHRQVVIFIYIITIALGLVAFSFTAVKDEFAAVLLVVIGIVIFLVVGRLGLSQKEFDLFSNRFTNHRTRKKDR
ncbi:MAG: undecaprenyl/decaprenyl-phosphate alpha-N-acetylglucosaminyl 1-phosphate transferase [Candidatus Omnitrophica bacterium]|nr:undecaprenyl/decaprenyl-phosphate alpha-N-acetylglucosaminyl 1-phosphate transferase [Candidatus Omnitrophota bacterium]